jgi:1-acyl-sn-glycerol-3-phosphate acyltransferase
VNVIGRVRVDNAGAIPPVGPVILAMNHRSLWDGPLLCGLTPRPVSCLVKAEAFVPVVASVLRHAGQVAVHRERIDPAPVRRCLDVLRAGGVVGIFPEGTRGSGAVVQVRPGVGYLALRTGAVVVPITAHGTECLVRGRRPIVNVTVGDPLQFDQVADRAVLSRQRYTAATEVIRVALADLANRPAAPVLPD